MTKSKILLLSFITVYSMIYSALNKCPEMCIFSQIVLEDRHLCSVKMVML